VVVPKKQSEDRYGSVIIDDASRITEFVEKGMHAGGKYINAGVYIFNKAVFEGLLLPKVFSLEQDFLSKSKLDMYAFIFNGSFTDIGTPESYRSFIDSMKSGGFKDFYDSKT
jgi:NDP-sugar pyrophosphorylase family protein